MRTGRPKAALVVTAEERAELESLAHRSRSAPALARRARLVLACAEGRDRIIDVPVDHAFVKDVPPTVALDPAPMAASAGIDPALEKTAAEFRTRLAYYAGSLLSITMRGGRFSAEWTSSKCDYFEAEVTDLVLSVERTMKASPSIHGKRTCDGNQSTFSIDETTFRRYRAGTIGDLEILKGIK